MFIVKDMPIRKNNKTYGVGEKFPYSDKDKSLLDKKYLIEIKDEPIITNMVTVKKEIPTKKKKNN